MLSGGLRILNHALISSSKCFLWFVPRTDTMAPEAGTICFTWMTWGWPFLLNPILKTTWAPSSNWIIADCTSHRIQLPSSWHYPEPVAQAQLGKGERGNSFSAPFFVADTARNPHLGSFWNHFLATNCRLYIYILPASTNVASTNCGIWSWDRIIIFGSRRVWIHPNIRVEVSVNTTQGTNCACGR